MSFALLAQEEETTLPASSGQEAIPQQANEAEPHVTPEEIHQELLHAEGEFKEAQQMFNPWYTGPLLAPSATMMPPGFANWQPYFFLNDEPRRYNNERKNVTVPTVFNFNPVEAVLIGIAPWLDCALTIQWNVNWQGATSRGGFGDTSLGFGFPLARESLYVPGVKFVIKEVFPSGRYSNLDPDKNGLDATGAGSYQTSFNIAIAKIVFWQKRHPMDLRLTAGYTLPTPVPISGFSAYGGGYGATGQLRPGNSFNTDLGIEYSVNQKFVLSADIVYQFQEASSGLSGYPGTLKDGTLSTVGARYSDQLSIAPAFEYNWNPSLGFVGGVWFTVYGRNSTDFVSFVLSITWTFQWPKN